MLLNNVIIFYQFNKLKLNYIYKIKLNLIKVNKLIIIFLTKFAIKYNNVIAKIVFYYYTCIAIFGIKKI